MCLKCKALEAIWFAKKSTFYEEWEFGRAIMYEVKSSWKALYNQRKKHMIRGRK